MGCSKLLDEAGLPGGGPSVVPGLELDGSEADARRMLHRRAQGTKGAL
jgi:hypothetical protein